MSLFSYSWPHGVPDLGLFVLLLLLKFDFDAVVSNVDGKRSARAPGRSHAFLDEETGLLVRLVPNDFPYWLVEGVEHMLLWVMKCNDDTTPVELDLELTRKLLASRLSNEVETCLKINVAANASIR